MMLTSPPPSLTLSPPLLPNPNPPPTFPNRLCEIHLRPVSIARYGPSTKTYSTCRRLRRWGNRSLHSLLLSQKGGIGYTRREILCRLRSLGEGRRIPRPRLVRWRPSGPTRSSQLQSPPLPRPELRLPSPYHAQSHGDRVGIRESIAQSDKENSRLGRWASAWAEDDRDDATTAQVHPQMFTRTLIWETVEKDGLEVVIGKVETVMVEGGRVDSVVFECGRVIESDAVVLALGPWCGKFEMLKSLFRVCGLRAHSLVLEPKNPDAIARHALFLSYYTAQGVKPIDPEVYPRPTGEVYLCGMSSDVEVPDDPEHITGHPESIQVLKRVAKTVSSHLGEGEAKMGC